MEKNEFLPFSGRATRLEFVMFLSVTVIVGLFFAYISVVYEAEKLFLAFCVIMILPSLSIQTRRLHDIGNSGWFQLITLIPVLGSLALLFFLFKEGDKGKNSYGEYNTYEISTGYLFFSYVTFFLSLSSLPFLFEANLLFFVIITSVVSYSLTMIYNKIFKHEKLIYIVKCKRYLLYTLCLISLFKFSFYVFYEENIFFNG